MTTLELDDDTLQIESVDVDDEHLHVRLKDGRRLSMPLWWSPRLLAATKKQRRQWRILPFGDALEWEELDEHLSIKGILRGKPPREAVRPLS